VKTLPIWLRDDGSVVSCTEKVKVMRENFEEIKQIAQDALEDGLLLEVSETQMRETLHQLIDQLFNPYQKQKATH
jgi:regulator of replication initiation timing